MGFLQCDSEHQRCLPAQGKQGVNEKQKSGGLTLPTYKWRKPNLSLHEISALSLPAEIRSMVQQFCKQKPLSLLGNFPKSFLQLFQLLIFLSFLFLFFYKQLLPPSTYLQLNPLNSCQDQLMYSLLNEFKICAPCVPFPTGQRSLLSCFKCLITNASLETTSQIVSIWSTLSCQKVKTFKLCLSYH